MLTQAAICIDIGSTYTKGARFLLNGDFFEPQKRAVTPTTTANLPDGFNHVYAKLSQDPSKEQVFFSSSAKGGLKVAVIGLVPEISLHIARLAAFSAGARICLSLPYKLLASHITQIEQQNPDILLLCGGTDGGNERYVTENATSIAQSSYDGIIIYAGNNLAADEISAILEHKKLLITENIMPDFGSVNTDPVRENIRKVFLNTIVSGKGLSELVDRFATEPVPTPMAMLNLVEAMGNNLPEWQNFALIDLGGATTDYYSFCEGFNAESGRVLKGIVEPKLKRTVEGDLGMRVSAESALETSRDFFANTIGAEKLALLEQFIAKLAQNPDYLPNQPEEMHFDRILAQGCIHHALLRHAGYMQQIFTVKGPVWAQTGKDLTKINRVIGTGGYLSALASNGENFSVKPTVFTGEKVPLTPQSADYYADEDYLLPLLGSLAKQYPRQTALTAASNLEKL